MARPVDIDEYNAGFPKEVRVLLEKMRSTIHKAAPKAEEIISYSMPAFKFKGLLVWYAAHTHHIGFYPRVSAMEAFKKELSPYKSAKGSVQFPFDKPLPVDLIGMMVKFRVQENLEKEALKKRR
ncbi:MAG: DUF1801 domain-containing protein [Saprospiraceae bacterium]